ncbi:MAG TPA: ATP-binding protein [Candidatus Thermoplasmatota archaeon]|nr:ATP-binding protein [Candidatus Thermoplasmatota archaeon]
MESALAGAAAPVAVAAPRASLLARAWNWLPQGRGLPEATWQVRHRAVVLLIFAHALGLCVFGFMQERSPVLAVAEPAAIALLGVIAALPPLSRSMRSGVAALALVTSSAVLTQFWGGVIEGHFHFFVVVAFISLYQDWVPFLLAILYVVLDHGLVGTLAPAWVYNHPDALAHPWKWAVIHAAMVLSECVALVVVWRANETARDETDRILRSAGEGILGIDAAGRVTFANPAARRMLAGSGGPQRPLHELVLGADGRPLFDGPAGLLRRSGAFQVEAFLGRPGGSRLPVELLCTPIEDRAHQEGAVVSFRDITDRRLAEKGRQEAEQSALELGRLQELNRFKTQFINTAAHELRTPLMPLRTQVHLMLNSTADPPSPTQRAALGVMQRNFTRLGTLVEDLLTVARSQAGRLGIAPEPIEVGKVLADAAEAFQPVAKDRGIALTLPANASASITADPKRLSQVVSNLLSNAFKFTPRGGRVRLELQDDGPDVRVQVTDTGHGIAKADLPRLFTPFVQVHDTAQVTEPGSGLGLYICKQFVEMHGGRIGVASAGLGKGSTFWFTLPKALPPSLAARAAPDPDGAAKDDQARPQGTPA